MPTYSTSTPAATIRTETEPSAADYQFWIKPSTNEAFFSDGTTWQEIPTGAPATAILGIENALNILEIQAADTITPDTSAQIVSDIFSDTTGYNNTIDTGNTTADFSVDEYVNYINLLTQDLTEISINETSFTKKREFTGLNNYIPFIKLNTKYYTPAYYSIIYVKFIFTDDTTYTTPQQTATTSTYQTYTFYNNSTSKSIKSVEIWARVSKAYTEHIDDVKVYEIGSIGTNKLIQTSKIDLPSTPSKFIVFAFRDNTTGTGNITADISFNNGANYQTGVNLNTETSIIDAGDEMILKLNLNAGASSGTAEAKGYGVLFW